MMNGFCNFIENNYESILVSIIAGIILIFLVFIFFRPWLSISKNICETNNEYKFKIINYTLFRCTNLKVYLRTVIESDAYPKGKDLSYKLIEPIQIESFIYIPSLITGIFSSKRENCLQVRVDKNIANLTNMIEPNGTHLELIVSTHHGMSNLQSTKKKVYKHII